MKLFEMQL